MSEPASSWFRPGPEGLTLYLRVTPNAGRDQIEGPELRDVGSAVLRVRVKAVPDKGKANAAVIALLAKALGIPKSSLSIISGDTSRLKTIAASGPPESLSASAKLL